MSTTQANSDVYQTMEIGKNTSRNEDITDFDSESQFSTLSRHDDPFAPRDGKTLIWKNVNMTLAASGDSPERKILDSVWGEVPRKKTTALMGPSGAGKSSLLNVLAGRASSRGRVTIESDIRLNNYEVDPSNIEVRKLIAFVAQDDSLQVTSTPRESIRFSAKLRLPRSTTEKQLDKITEHMLTELGLKHCADTIVGGPLIKGISGGERKRTSVGVELVVKPALVFLDEPTSGLDSFSAVQLCQVLKKVAHAGASVLFTIHQPSSEIFSSFDHLLLLNKGRIMYQGAVPDIPRYFAEHGHPNPPNYNPADWIMNVAQSVPIKELDEKGFFPKDEREIGEAFTGYMEGKDALGITITRHKLEKFYDGTPVGTSTQIYLLFQRELKNLKRDTGSLFGRFGVNLFMALLIGVIFHNVGQADPSSFSNVKSSFGALLSILLMGMFGTANPALLSFPQERPVFLREYSTNHYSVFSYFTSRLTMEALLTAAQILMQAIISYFLIGFRQEFGIFFASIYMLAMTSTASAVMIGSAVEDPKLGIEISPVFFVPQMLFAGFFVAPDLIPVWLRWARYACFLTYPAKISLDAEFSNCAAEGTDALANCETLLSENDVNPDETWWNWLVLAGMFVAFRVLALVILRQKATKFY